MGVQAYAGNNMHIVGFDNRREASLRSLERAVAAADAIKRAGLVVTILSVGGTGTYNIDTGFAGVTEIQPGSYIFMDSHYRSIGNETVGGLLRLRQLTRVLTTVISRPSKGRAITDGGNKALSSDAGLPALKDGRGVAFQAGGDEHGVLLLRDPSATSSRAIRWSSSPATATRRSTFITCSSRRGMGPSKPCGRSRRGVVRTSRRYRPFFPAFAGLVCRDGRASCTPTVPIITSVDLMMARASSPRRSFSASKASAVITAVSD